MLAPQPPKNGEPDAMETFRKLLEFLAAKTSNEDARGHEKLKLSTFTRKKNDIANEGIVE